MADEHQRRGAGPFSAVYDGEGMRAWKQTGTGQKTFFLYDGDRLVAEEDAAGNLLASDVWGPDGLRERNMPGVRDFSYLYDASGNLLQRVRQKADGTPYDNACWTRRFMMPTARWGGNSNETASSSKKLL